MKQASKEYIYIAQASEKTRCKIGKTNNLERRLKDYNSTTGVSVDDFYKYLFTCEVKDATVVERDIKKEFFSYRELDNREIYLCNAYMFEKYVEFIKSHPLFIKEIFRKIDTKKQITKIVPKTRATLEERGITFRKIMSQAQRADNDEFYTRYEDIEKEISMYDKSIWKDKCVFCNCDDAVGKDDKSTSAFALYFLNNFKELGLKKLICTHYSGGLDIFNQGTKGYVFTKNGFCEIEDYELLKKYPKGYTGSFDDPISLEILEKDADIVCTNPPFSKAIEYWKIVIGSGKKFIVISNITNVLNIFRKLYYSGDIFRLIFVTFRPSIT
jgi:hypothetical protein